MMSFPMIPNYIMIPICLFLIIFIIFWKKRKITYLLMILLIFLINERFMIPSGTTETMDNNADVLFVIDTTISMNAEDYNKETRLEGVKKDCKKIIEELNGARFSYIIFNNDAKLMIPATKDANMVKDAIDITEPIIELYARGTSLNTPISLMKNTLNKSYQQNKNRTRIVFFISDGEITDKSELKKYDSLRKYITDGAVLGYGTKTGGYMKYKSYYSQTEEVKEEYIMDYSDGGYNKAISKLDEKNLKAIASDLGISYIHMTKSSMINQPLEKIKSQITQNKKPGEQTCYDDIYYIFVFPLLGLIVYESKKARRMLS